MLRRKPTRLELKLDDTEEFESVKKEIELSARHSSRFLLTVMILTLRDEILHGAPEQGRLSMVLYVFHFLTIAATSRKKQREDVDVVGIATTSDMSSATGTSEGKIREQIHERIGYKPHPKPNTLSSFFGNLQF